MSDSETEASIEVLDQEIVPVARSAREDLLVKSALMFLKTSESKWSDARGQKGPSPSDFGDHKPIPVDAVCASVVLTDEGKED